MALGALQENTIYPIFYLLKGDYTLNRIFYLLKGDCTYNGSWLKVQLLAAGHARYQRRDACTPLTQGGILQYLV